MSSDCLSTPCPVERVGSATADAAVEGFDGPLTSLMYLRHPVASRYSRLTPGCPRWLRPPKSLNQEITGEDYSAYWRVKLELKSA